MLCIANLEITLLRWRKRGKQGPAGLQIEHRRSIETIQTSYQDDIPLHAYHADDGGADRVGPYWRTK